jgi:DNA-binding response OmpR family regulator
MPKVLIVDDEPDIVDLVMMYLKREGYELHVARDGPAALDLVKQLSPDVIVLDINLPGMDGLTICREIRKSRNVPILMLSARGSSVDKVLGLEMGADDYLAKPFDPHELVARVRSMMRRWTAASTSAAADEIMTHRGLVLRVKAQRLETQDGTEIVLTPLEFSLMRTFMQRAGHVLSRQQLLDLVWGQEFVGDERTVDVHIRHLRAKLKQAAGPQTFISSIWGTGYRFEP